MKIIKLSQYKKEVQKKIYNKHLIKEKERLEGIEELLINSDSLKDLLLNPLSKIYGIEKKSGNLKEIYTAKLNSKLRLYIKPLGIYPYDKEFVVEVELLKIDDKHYGDG